MFLPESLREPLKQGLYIIATPIGNLADITLRALQTLDAVDVIYAEDTRVTHKLLAHYNIRTKLEAYHDYSSDHTRDHIVARIAAGERVALVSDAGTPLISDPGYKLVQALQEAHLPVITLPGPSACLGALTVSGLPPHPFLFLGFLPSKAAARQTMLKEYGKQNATLIFYESPRRLVALLHELAQLFPHHEIAVVRELTKRFEEVKRAKASLLVEYYEAHPPLGEIVVLIGPAPEAAMRPQEEAVEAALAQALKTMSVRDAADLVAGSYGLPKKEVYRLALNVKNQPL